MLAILTDLRFAIRGLRQKPRLVVLVVLTMAVGIGANLGVFAYLSYFARPTIDAPGADRLTWLYTATKEDAQGRSSYPDWLDISRNSRDVFSQFAAYRLFGASMQVPGKTLHTWAHAVSGEYFSLFGAQPEIGRLLQSSDDVVGAERALVLSHLRWTRDFDADPAIVGQSVLLDGRHSYTVVGVTRPGFQGEGIWTGIYVAFAGATDIVAGLEERGDRRVAALARLQADVSFEQAQARLVPVAKGIDESYPEPEPRELRLLSVHTFQNSWEGEPLYTAARVLMAAVSLLLVLACANVANLLLARNIARGPELALHRALGASRARLAFRLVIESVLMSVAGGAFGLALARGLTRLIEHYLRQEVPLGMGDWSAGTTLILDETELFVFFAGVSLLTGLVFGVGPVLQTWRRDMVAALKSGVSGEGAHRGWHARDLLVVAQVALSTVLLIGAGLLGRTLIQVGSVDLGFDTRELMLATVYLPKERVVEGRDGAAIYDDIVERVRTLAGVESAGLVWRAPLTFAQTTGAEIASSRERDELRYNVVGEHYFQTLGVALLAGRNLNRSDDLESPHVVVLNRTAAERYWPDTDPVGQQLRLFDQGIEQPGAVHEVVGVVADMHHEPPYRPIEPLVYLPFHQRPSARMHLMVRGHGSVAPQIYDLLHTRYPDLAIIALAPFEEQYRRAVADQRMNAELAGGLGALGLLLATLGIFSVLAYTVSRKTREIGIRVAVGARRADVWLWVLKGTAQRVGFGLAIGLALAWLASRNLASLLVGVEAGDPITFVVVPAVVGVTALLAALIPARKATEVDPLRALREP